MGDTIPGQVVQGSIRKPAKHVPVKGVNKERPFMVSASSCLSDDLQRMLDKPFAPYVECGKSPT